MRMITTYYSIQYILVSLLRISTDAKTDYKETYFWVKQGGTFIDTACSRDSIPCASQNGRSTLAPFST